jgi:hypothetical protein
MVLPASQRQLSDNASAIIAPGIHADLNLAAVCLAPPVRAAAAHHLPARVGSEPES